MLRILTILVALVCGSLAGMTDLNCTSFDTNAMKYDATAVNCQNKYPDADCVKLFGNAVAINTDAERPDNCFKNAAGNPDQTMKQLAISMCPLTCGYCCLTPAYNCQNKPNPRIPCGSITGNMCTNPTWHDIIVEDCPKSCGFCDQGDANCVDMATDCGRFPEICRSIDLQDFVKKNCRRTCGFCKENGGTTTAAPTTNCGTDPKCADWVRNGFCNSNFYTLEQKKQYCGKACNLC